MANKQKFVRIEGVENYTPVPIMIYSLLYALFFGACSVFPWMVLKSLAPDVALALGMDNSRATGFIYILSTLVFGVIAFSFFLVLWHKLEKHFSHKKSILTTLKWSAVSVAIGLVSYGLYIWLESLKVAVI